MPPARKEGSRGSRCAGTPAAVREGGAACGGAALGWGDGRAPPRIQEEEDTGRRGNAAPYQERTVLHRRRAGKGRRRNRCPRGKRFLTMRICCTSIPRSVDRGPTSPARTPRREVQPG